MQWLRERVEGVKVGEVIGTWSGDSIATWVRWEVSTKLWTEEWYILTYIFKQIALTPVWRIVLKGKEWNQAKQLGSYFNSTDEREWWWVATIGVVRKVRFCIYFDVRTKRISWQIGWEVWEKERSHGWLKHVWSELWKWVVTAIKQDGETAGLSSFEKKFGEGYIEFLMPTGYPSGHIK